MGIVTISRQHGSGGTNFARQLAQRLGYTFINRMTVNNQCRESEVHARIFGIDRSPELADKLVQFMADADFYKICFTASILDHALRNNVVMTGMGAGILLSGIGNTVNLRVVRLMAERVRGIAQVKDVPYDDAFDLVERMEEEKQEFITRYYNVDVNDPTLYHAVINSSCISLDEAIDITANYTYKHCLPSHTKETEQALKNRLIENRAEVLLFHLGLEHSYGKVVFRAHDDGIITVSGAIRNEAERVRLIEALKGSSDVSAVEELVSNGAA